MLNVQNITSKLASLPDQALQQYAAMNKNDPYIMALAVSESNRRKQVRAAQQAQGMQEQPKVVDQALQGMAQPMPEDVGIGQLPAGEMEFAGGGILAFAPGGATGGPNASFVEYLRSIGKTSKDFVEATPKEQAALKAGFEKAISGPRMPPPTTTAAAEGVAAAESAASKVTGKAGMLGRLGRAASNPYLLGVAGAYELSKIPGVQDAVGGAYDALKDFATSERFLSAEDKNKLDKQSGRPSKTDQATIDRLVAAEEANPYTDRLRVGGEGAIPAVPGQGPVPIEQPSAAPAASAAPTGLAQIAPPTAAVAANVGPMDIAGKLKELQPFYKSIDNKPAEAIAKAQGAKETAFATKAVEAEKKLQAELGEYGVGREKRLKEREAKLSQDEKSNYGLAFLEAGLAMMGGESPNAFANISKGALQGMGSYKKGLASINESKEKLFDAYDALEKDRRSDKTLSADRLQQREAAVVAAEGRLSDKLFTLATDKGKADADTARALATASIGAAATEWSAKQRAAEGAADRQTRVDAARYDADVRRDIAQMPSAEQRMYEKLGGGDLKKGMEEAAKIKAATKTDVFSLYSDWLKANPTLAMDPNKAMATFFKQYGIMSGSIPKPSNSPTGVVRE